jgi:hypothetical protein
MIIKKPIRITFSIIVAVLPLLEMILLAIIDRYYVSRYYNNLLWGILSLVLIAILILGVYILASTSISKLFSTNPNTRSIMASFIMILGIIILSLLEFIIVLLGPMFLMIILLPTDSMFVF